MPKEKWEVLTRLVNGERHVFEADFEYVSRHDDNCGHCGGNCSGEFKFWYEEGLVRKTVFVGKMTLHQLLDFPENECDQPLPDFIKEWNWSMGWLDECEEAMDGIQISNEKILDGMNHIDADSQTKQKIVQDIKDLVAASESVGSSMHISYF